MIAMSSRWLCSARQMQLNSHCCWNHSSHGAFFGLHFQGAGWHEQSFPTRNILKHGVSTLRLLSLHATTTSIHVWSTMRFIKLGLKHFVLAELLARFILWPQKSFTGASSIRRLQEQRGTPQVMSSAPICTEMWARRGTQLTAEMERFWWNLVTFGHGSGWFWLVLVGSWFHCCGCF